MVTGQTFWCQRDELTPAGLLYTSATSGNRRPCAKFHPLDLSLNVHRIWRTIQSAPGQQMLSLREDDAFIEY